jgi:4-hydroxy-2-oxoheptanedioate aldolase
MKSFSMRPSRVLRKLRAGEIVNCFKCNLSDHRAFQIVSQYGFDCIWTCMEHVPNDLSQIETQVLATKNWDVDLLCRVPRGSYSDYVRPLELDASGIMLPHVMSLQDAKDIIYQTRFMPIGRRAADGGNADGLFCNVEFTDYLEQANRERFIILQIEDPEVLDDLEAICELEGFDVILFGAGDFSHAIGHPGEMDHPMITETYERIGKLANKHGKFAGAVAAPAKRQQMIDMGYTFLNTGADVIGLGMYCKDIAEACGVEDIADPNQYGGKVR